MLNCTEHNGVVIIDENTLIARGIIINTSKWDVIFINGVRDIVNDVIALIKSEVNKLCGEYQAMCEDFRDDKLLTTAERGELLEVAYDDFSRSIDTLYNQWKDDDSVDPIELCNIFNLEIVM